MPAHDPQAKDKALDMHVLVVDVKTWNQHIPDGHVYIKFEWRGGTHSWFVEGVGQPESPLMDPKHNWTAFEKNLPQSQGDAILRFLEWVKGLSQSA